MKKVVYNSQYQSEFETKWMEMLQKYKLYDNEWLKTLYEERHRWVPCYLNDCFWDGMQSTQKSESMNSFFDGYLGPKTTLKQFVEQFERATRDKAEKEVADMAVKSELSFNDVKQLLVIQLDLLKKNNEIQEIETKSPTTNEKCTTVQEIETKSPTTNDDAVVVDVLNPKEKTKGPGRPRSNTYKKATWKRNNKNPIDGNNMSTYNEEDGLASVDVPKPKTKKRGRPPGSKNKNHKTTNLDGDGNVQVVPQQERNGIEAPNYIYQADGVLSQVPMWQYKGVIGQTHMYQGNRLLPQVPMYQPWGSYQHPPAPYAGLPMDFNGASSFHMQEFASVLPPSAPNLQMFKG